MSSITFYAKPNCRSNRKQKRLLRQAGFELREVDLLTHPWTREELMAFFLSLPVNEWFNLAAPQLRDGAVDPDQLQASEALDLMIAEPLLIRRPLLEYRGFHLAGFDQARVEKLLGVRLHLAGTDADTLERCSHPVAAEAGL